MSNKLKVQDLRDELEKRGLDTAGLKPALVSRLDAAIASEAQTNGDVASDEDALPKSDKDVSKKHPRDDEADAEADAKRLKVEDVDKLSVDELRTSLKALGSSAAGSKATLKKRLLSALAGSQSQVLPDGDRTEDTDEKRVTATKKGDAVLDQHLPDHIKASHHVLADLDCSYDAMLNQTNVGANNNKYYVIQALENDAGTSYLLYTRWGRVGNKGQSKTEAVAGKEGAKAAFKGAFFSKTKNDWNDRHDFKPYSGKYTWLEMDYSLEEEENQENDKPQKLEAPKKAPSKKNVQPDPLDPLVRKLIQTICDVNMMNSQMAEIGYDARKLPLGKLSKSTVRKGYDALKRLAASLEGGINISELQQLSSEFYTVIPHDFGHKRMSAFTIDTLEKLKKKLEMVEALGQIELASKIVVNESETTEDPIFAQYKKLQCGIEPVRMDSDEADWIKAYLHNTHNKSAHSYFSLDLEQIFKVVREPENRNFEQFSKEENRMLLWHGSRLCNWTGILSQGLRIAPPEAPVNGYMFGKGVYFADMASKSAGYCCPSGKNSTGLLLLSEVALGTMRELHLADYKANELPPGKLSTKGLGSTIPDPKQLKILPDGVIVPMGKPIKSKTKGGSLIHNEYIVYNTAQIRMKYLLMVKF